tara:strand:- start:273 stop:554 length:282 start_codon:yes stop_codon:yes gene_type:complete
MHLPATILFGVSHACVDIHSEAEVRTVSDIDPSTFPDTLAYLDSVNGTVERVLATPYTGWLIQVDYSNSTGSYSLQTRVPWRTNWEIVTECYT